MTRIVRLSGIDHMNFEAAAIDGTRWNGWVMPHFTKPQAQRVAAWFWKHGADGTPRLHLDTTTGAFIGTEDGEPVEYPANTDGTYSLGAANWCWELNEPNRESAGADLADAFSHGELIGEIATMLACSEVEALAQFLRTHEEWDAAQFLIEAHAEVDEADEYDRH